MYILHFVCNLVMLGRIGPAWLGFLSGVFLCSSCSLGEDLWSHLKYVLLFVISGLFTLYCQLSRCGVEEGVYIKKQQLDNAHGVNALGARIFSVKIHDSLYLICFA